MNENVSIKEGNITRKFAPIDKVKVDNTDGTSSIWVPEDDLKTGVLYASENGIYIASEDGYDAYSEVVIRVEKRIDDGDLIDESGTDWKDIDFDGDIGNFDELDNWDVDTLEEFSDDLEGFDDLFNDEDKWDEEKEKPITEDEMGDFDGDSLSGIDPETGNEMEVSLDEDGFLDEEVLPSSIVITREPFRLKYMNGEMISFAGLVVDAYNADGSHYGTIPIGELVFPVKKANADVGEKLKYATSDIYDGQISFTTSVSLHGFFNSGVGKFENFDTWTGGDAMACEYVEKTTHILAASKEPFGITETGASIQKTGIRIGENDSSWSWTRTDGLREYTHSNKKVYWMTSGLTFGALYDESVGPQTSYPSSYANEFAWTMIYGNIEEEATMDVPVYWMRSDGEVLSDSFTITVIPNGSEGGDSGGSSWDGNISYGGNDYMLNPNSVVGLSYNPESKKVIAPNIGEYKVDQAIDVGLLIPKEE